MAVDDGYTVVLMHFDGVDGSTDFIDESGKAWTNSNSDLEIDTARAKFGASSLLNGNVALGGYITTADHADFSFGSDDWTVEFWEYIVAYQSGTLDGYSFFTGASSAGSDTTVKIKTDTTGIIRVDFGHGGTSVAIIASDAMSTGQWYHIAVVKYGANGTIYLNGVQQAQTTALSGPLIEPTIITFGGGYNSGTLNASYDELRISKGIARYTAEFTPPGVPFGAVGSWPVYYADGLSIY